eukprot:2790674-Amphidinium_carterae.1
MVLSVSYVNVFGLFFSLVFVNMCSNLIIVLVLVIAWHLPIGRPPLLGRKPLPCSLQKTQSRTGFFDAQLQEVLENKAFQQRGNVQCSILLGSGGRGSNVQRVPAGIED